MLDFIETPRFKSTGGEAQIRELFAKQKPFIIEEADNPLFQAFAERCTAQRFGEIWGDREWRVQNFKKGEFDPFVPPVANTSVMTFPEFLERYENPEEGWQTYLNIWPTPPATDFADPFFQELRALGKELEMTKYDGQDLKTFWMGGPGTITPLHHDTYARSHGTISGLKRYVFFPPDRKHLKKLKPYSVRSTQGWWSNIGFGPLDPEIHPQLKDTEPWLADCGPGDFVWLPPCWWHHVSIPSEPTITISATHHDPHTSRYYYHWRIRLTRWIGRQRWLKPITTKH